MRRSRWGSKVSSLGYWCRYEIPELRQNCNFAHKTLDFKWGAEKIVGSPASADPTSDGFVRTALYFKWNAIAVVWNDFNTPQLHREVIRCELYNVSHKSAQMSLLKRCHDRSESNVSSIGYSCHYEISEMGQNCNFAIEKLNIKWGQRRIDGAGISQPH